MKFIHKLAVSAVMSLGVGASTASAQPAMSLAQFQKRPKLIVVIVVDQFRSDYLTRFSDKFLPAKSSNGGVGGFLHLMSQSAYYPAAKYDALQNMTCPGHTMILTGTYPYRSGIPINVWYDHTKKKMRYCVEDDEFGVSPRSIVGDTVGDELKNAGYASKVYALALKDRSAIALGGHRADLSFWLDENGDWSTSRYYSKDLALPEWLKDENAKLKKTRGREITWSAGGFVRKALEGSSDSLLLPYGAEITTDAAIATLIGAKLGQGSATDLLAVSYSTHDLLGHKTGPNSKEMEEITIAEDKAIARFLNAIRKAVPGGLENVVIALTADHGVSPSPDYLANAKILSGRMKPSAMLEEANKKLNSAFGKPSSGSWVVAEEALNFYLSPESLNAKGIDRAAVEQEVKKYFLTVDGAFKVFTKTEYEKNQLPPGEFERQIKKTYVPGKSGDVVVIPKPFWTDSGAVATHMTGYSYDRSVPLLIAGPNIRSGVYAKEADIIDLAPTLSFLTGTVAPAQSEGRVLSEIFGPRRKTNRSNEATPAP